jgi:hypothetical protein
MVVGPDVKVNQGQASRAETRNLRKPSYFRENPFDFASSPMRQMIAPPPDARRKQPCDSD